MPRKRKGANLGRQTSRAAGMRNRRAQRTEEQIQQENTDRRVSMAQLRQEESEDARAERNELRRLEQRQARRFTVNKRRANDEQRQQMPKNPWTYKRRKRRQKRKTSVEDGELIENSVLPNSSELEIHIGSLSSEILPVPLNQLKKEIIYPDTRFQSSTTLFPAIVEDSLQSEIPIDIVKHDPEEEKNGSEQETERIGCYRVPDPDDASISKEVMSEIPLPNDNPMENEDTIYPDMRCQRPTTLFPAEGIENIIPSEKSSEAEDDICETTSKKVKMSDSDDCLIIENPVSQVEVEIDLTDDSHRILSQFITLD